MQQAQNLPCSHPATCPGSRHRWGDEVELAESWVTWGQAVVAWWWVAQEGHRAGIQALCSLQVLGAAPVGAPQPCSCCMVLTMLFVTPCLSFPTAKGTVTLLGTTRAAY